MLKERLEKENWYKISDLFYFYRYSSDDDKKEPRVQPEGDG